LARKIAADAVWRRLVTDPLSGAVLDYGRTTYRPPAALADFVRARDRSCRGPLCGHTAANCELDHAVAWAEGGETSADNLNPFCKHDHRLKTYGRWRIEIHADGSLTWVTPTGLRHTTVPYNYRDPPPEPDPPPPPPAPPPYDPERDPPPF
jgi:HNH endonuclease